MQRKLAVVVSSVQPEYWTSCVIYDMTIDPDVGSGAATVDVVESYVGVRAPQILVYLVTYNTVIEVRPVTTHQKPIFTSECNQCTETVRRPDSPKTRWRGWRAHNAATT